MTYLLCSQLIIEIGLDTLDSFSDSQPLLGLFFKDSDTLLVPGCKFPSCDYILPYSG